MRRVQLPEVHLDSEIANEVKPSDTDTITPRQRRAARLPLSIQLIVQPMLTGGVPVGPKISAVTRDVSKFGLGFLSVRRVEAEWVEIQDALQTQHRYHCRVVHSGERLNEESLFLTGVEFATETDRRAASRLVERARQLGL